jgi:hypothetical protein
MAPEVSSSLTSTLFVLIMLTYVLGTLGLGLAQKFFSSPPESPMDVLSASCERGQLFNICSWPNRVFRQLSIAPRPASCHPMLPSAAGLIVCFNIIVVDIIVSGAVIFFFIVIVIIIISSSSIPCSSGTSIFLFICDWTFLFLKINFFSFLLSIQLKHVI